MADAGSSALLQGLVGLLQQASPAQQQPQQVQFQQDSSTSAALAALLSQQTQAAAPVAQAPAAGGQQNTAALAQIISSVASALGGVAAAQQQQHHAAGQAVLHDSRAGIDAAFQQELLGGATAAGAPTAPGCSVEEFVIMNGLEAWVGEALHLLGEDQKAHVMRTHLNPDNTTNLNGVVTSRIKEVAPVEQRLDMFVKLNGLAPGVVDRLGTLTPDQHEKVMESTLKIQKANNPSGVAMRRITDVLRSERMGIPHGPHMSAPGFRDVGAVPQQAYTQQATQQAAAANLLTSLVETLGGSAGHREDRSRSRPPAGGGAPGGAGMGAVPRDIQTFVEQYNLEWWVGEVLARLSLFQRQQVMTELANMHGVRNPSGVVMARVKQAASTQELITIFIDINNLDQQVSADLWSLSEDNQLAVIAPGIYIQNARNASVAALSRIKQVLAGNDAMGGAKRQPAVSV